MTMSHEATELTLYINNTAPVYFKYLVPCIANLDRHKRLGHFDKALALKALGRVATYGARSYHAEHCSPSPQWFRIFSTAARAECAQALYDTLED